MSTYMKLFISFFLTFFGGFAVIFAGGINDNIFIMIVGTVLSIIGTVLLILLSNLDVKQRAAYLRGE